MPASVGRPNVIWASCGRGPSSRARARRSGPRGGGGGPRGIDHALEALDLGPQGRDLAVDPLDAFTQQGALLRRVGGRAEAGARLRPGVLVLEQLADLGQAEAGVVAQALDELEARDVVRVVEPVRPARARRLQEPDLLVVADRPRGQPDLVGDLLDAELRLDIGRG